MVETLAEGSRSSETTVHLRLPVLSTQDLRVEVARGGQIQAVSGLAGHTDALRVGQHGGQTHRRGLNPSFVTCCPIFTSLCLSFLICRVGITVFSL